MTVIGKLGDRARVTIRRVVRVQYRLEWEYDGVSVGYDLLEDREYGTPARKAKARYVSSAAVAYRMAAMRLIFAKRDKLATSTSDNGYPTGCSLCGVTPGGPEDPGLCRYHGGDGFEYLRKRLARWLRWRDSVGVNSDRSIRERLSRARDAGMIGRKSR